MKAKKPCISIKSLAKKFPESAQRLELFDSILKTAYSVGFKHQDKLSPETVRSLLQAGTPLLDTASFDENAFAGVFSRLLKQFHKNNPEEFSTVIPANVPQGLFTAHLDADADKMTDFSEALSMSTATLVSCCQQAARPQLDAFAQINSEANTGLWSESCCPFCGALPAMALVESSGARRLFCPNCLSDYRFSRHYCPACGHGGLNVLQMDAWPGLLIESCPECRLYLKTWSSGDGEPPCPFPWFDIVTYAVDEAAELQGLKRMSLSVMGV